MSRDSDRPSLYTLPKTFSKIFLRAANIVLYEASNAVRVQ